MSDIHLGSVSQRKLLPNPRHSITAKNSCGAFDIYVIVSFYDDEPLRPGEVFVHVAKEGSTLGGLCSAIACVLSIALQHGTPWPELARHLRGACFEPQGYSLDRSEHYPSISHAIASTVGQIITQREFELQSLSGLPDPALGVSPPEPSPSSANPSRASDAPS